MLKLHGHLCVGKHSCGLLFASQGHVRGANAVPGAVPGGGCASDLHFVYGCAFFLGVVLSISYAEGTFLSKTKASYPVLVDKVRIKQQSGFILNLVNKGWPPLLSRGDFTLIDCGKPVCTCGAVLDLGVTFCR